MHQEASRHGQLPARHRDGALVEVHAERAIDRIVDHAEGFHVVRKREVAKARALLGGRDGLVDVDRWIIGDEADEPENLAQRFARLMAGQDQIGDGDRARVDEGIARDAVLALELDDGVERAAPDGSRPTRRHSRSPTLPSASVSVKTFEMLWIENGTSLSPPAATCPSASITTRPNFPGSACASSGM
jgi:hypothetical protein